MSTLAGYQWSDIEACIEWMAPFARVLRESGPAEFKFFDRVPSSEVHNIQTHMTNTKLLVRLQLCSLILGVSIDFGHIFRLL